MVDGQLTPLRHWWIVYWVHHQRPSMALTAVNNCVAPLNCQEMAPMLAIVVTLRESIIYTSTDKEVSRRNTLLYEFYCWTGYIWCPGVEYKGGYLPPVSTTAFYKYMHIVSREMLSFYWSWRNMRVTALPKAVWYMVIYDWSFRLIIFFIVKHRWQKKHISELKLTKDTRYLFLTLAMFFLQKTDHGKTTPRCIYAHIYSVF